MSIIISVVCILYQTDIGFATGGLTWPFCRRPVRRAKRRRQLRLPSANPRGRRRAAHGRRHQRRARGSAARALRLPAGARRGDRGHAGAVRPVSGNCAHSGHVSSVWTTAVIPIGDTRHGIIVDISHILAHARVDQIGLVRWNRGHAVHVYNLDSLKLLDFTAYHGASNTSVSGKLSTKVTKLLENSAAR